MRKEFFESDQGKYPSRTQLDSVNKSDQWSLWNWNPGFESSLIHGQ